MKLASLIALVAAAGLAPARNAAGSEQRGDARDRRSGVEEGVGDGAHGRAAARGGSLRRRQAGVRLELRRRQLALGDRHRRRARNCTASTSTPLSRPHGLSAIGNKVYFTAEANKVIGRYDPATNKVDMVLGTGQNSTHMVLALPDESRIFTSNIGSDSITIIERAGVGNWNETVVPVGKGPEGFDLSPDGKQLWAANSRDGSVSDHRRRDEAGREHVQRADQAVEPPEVHARRAAAC